MAYGDVDSPFVVLDTPVVHEVPRKELKPQLVVQRNYLLPGPIESARVELRIKNFDSRDQRIFHADRGACLNCGELVWPNLGSTCKCGFPIEGSLRGRG